MYLGGLPSLVGSISAVSRVWSLILPEELFRGMSVGSFSPTAAGNRVYIIGCPCKTLYTIHDLMVVQGLKWIKLFMLTRWRGIGVCITLISKQWCSCFVTSRLPDKKKYFMQQESRERKNRETDKEYCITHRN